MLRYSDLPAAAKTALEAAIPGFEPYQLADYPASERAIAQVSGDAGLTVARGHFRDSATVDYVVAGHDRRLNVVVALFGEPNGHFRVSYIHGPSSEAYADASPWVDSLGTLPASRLFIEPGDLRAPIVYALTPVEGKSMSEYVRYAKYHWNAKLKHWLTDEPVD